MKYLLLNQLPYRYNVHVLYIIVHVSLHTCTQCTLYIVHVSTFAHCAMYAHVNTMYMYIAYSTCTCTCTCIHVNEHVNVGSCSRIMYCRTIWALSLPTVGGGIS